MSCSGMAVAAHPSVTFTGARILADGGNADAALAMAAMSWPALPGQCGHSALVVSVDAAHGCLLGGADSRQDGVALGV